MSNMMLGWRNHAENATLASSTPAQTDAGVSKVVNRRVAKAFRAKASSRRQMSITLDLGLTYSQALARVITLTRHVLGTRGRFRIQAGNVADLGDPALNLDFLTNTLDDRITFTRASTATYFDADGVLQSAATNVPRFDHDPITGARRGLLIEGAGTNLRTYSQALDNAAYTASRASLVPNVDYAPDGTLTAYALIEDGTGGNTHQVAHAASLTTGTAYTTSLFVKPRGRYRFGLAWIGAGAYSATQRATFNLRTGAVTVDSGSPTTHIRRLRGGWWRIGITATTTSTANGTAVLYLDNGTTVGYDGDTLSGALVWGAQIEAGSFPTSYIPTTTTAVTRSADVATIEGADFTSWFKQGMGSALASFEVATSALLRYVYDFSDGTFSNSINLVTSAGDNYAPTVVEAGVTQAQILQGGVTPLSENRVAFAWAGNDFATSAGGRTVGTDASGSIPRVDRLTLGARRVDAVTSLYGWLREFAYFSRRLPNAALEAWSRRGATINTDFAACDVDLPVEYTFTRASGGGYVDALGRLQGQYPAITAPIVPQTTRQERVKNGGFDTDTLWTKGTGWTIGSGVATKSAGTGSNLVQNIPTIPGQIYRVRFEVTSYSAGGMALYRVPDFFLLGVAAVGAYTATFTALSTTTEFVIAADAAFAGTIDNVSVTLDTGLRIPVGAGQDVKVGQLMRISPQEGTANTYMLGKVVAYDGAIVTVDVVEAAAPELISNGHFTSATTGWTAEASASLAVSSGELEVTWGASASQARQTVSSVTNLSYLLDVEARNGTATQWEVLIETNIGGTPFQTSGTAATAARVVHSITAASSVADHYIRLRATGSAGQTVYFDNISVKRAHTAWIVSLAGPRFTHDTDGTALGLLVEPGATNLVLNSEKIGSLPSSNVTVTERAAEAPNGQRSAALITKTASVGYVAQVGVSFTAQTYTQWAFAKAGTNGGFLAAAVQPIYANRACVVFNLLTGTVTGTAAPGGSTTTVVEAYMENWGDGWYKCVFVATSAGAATGNVYWGPSAGDYSSITDAFNGAGAADCYLYGPSFEAGSVATSYIPTFGVTRSRSADVCTIEGDEFTARVRQDAGTMLVGFRFNDGGVSGNRYPATIESNGNNRHGVLVVGSSNLLYADIREAGVNQATWTMLNNAVDGTEYTAALAYSAASSNTALDGTAGTEDTSATIPTTSQITFGHRAGLEWMVGTLPRFVYFPERRSDADLVAMTTSGADLDAYTIPGTLADAYAGTYDSDWLDAWVGGHAATDLGANEATLRLILAADVAYRYWRIDQYDHPGPDADPAGADDAVTLEAGYLGLWRVWQPALNPVYGFQDILEARTRVLESWSGSEDFERSDPARALTPSWDYLSEADMKIARQIMRYADTDTPMYFILDPAEADDWIESDILCRFQSLTAIEAAVFERFSMAFRLKQWA